MPTVWVPATLTLMPTTTARILELRADGMTYAQIAAQVGLSVSWVGELVRAHERRLALETQKTAPR